MAKDCTSPKTCLPSEHTARVRLLIMQRRKDGVPFPKIAEELDYTQGYVYKQYRKALKAIYAPETNEVRKLELERLDDMQNTVTQVLKAFHPLVSGGSIVRDVVDDDTGQPILNANGKPVTVRLRDYGPTLAAIDKAMKIMDRRAKLLGLDAPSKTAFTNPNGDKEAGFVQFYLPSNGREVEVVASEEAEAVDASTPEAD